MPGSGCSDFRGGERTYGSAAEVADCVVGGVGGGVAEEDVCFGVGGVVERGVAVVVGHCAYLVVELIFGSAWIPKFGGEVLHRALAMLAALLSASHRQGESI